MATVSAPVIMADPDQASAPSKMRSGALTSAAPAGPNGKKTGLRASENMATPLSSRTMVAPTMVGAAGSSSAAAVLPVAAAAYTWTTESESETMVWL